MVEHVQTEVAGLMRDWLDVLQFITTVPPKPTLKCSHPSLAPLFN